jgi:DMSO/TMAO reductase YedYZ heme-binding membrane subunit
MQALPYWPKLHALAVAHKKFILFLFLMANILVVVLALVAGLTFQYSRPDYGQMIEVGQHLGQVALLCYLLTLLPGIMKRLSIFPLERVTLMLFRRQLGVLMFITAYVHGAIVSTIPMLFTTGIQPDLFSNREQLGMLAIWILLPLWLTSNDLSTKFLGKKWQWVHRLTYLALLIIFLHVLLSTAVIWKVLGGAVLLLEVWSWVVQFRSNKKINK